MKHMLRLMVTMRSSSVGLANEDGCTTDDDDYDDDAMGEASEYQKAFEMSSAIVSVNQ